MPSGAREAMTILVDCEAVEQAGAARAHQVVLAAAPAGVRRVPRLVVCAAAVKMAELRGARRLAGPVAAGMIGGILVTRAIGLRACQHIVLVGSVAPAGNSAALFGDPRNFTQIVAQAGEFQCVTMQICDVVGDFFALGVIPGTVSDAVTRVHGVRTLRAEISVERLRTSGGGRERLAGLISAGQAAEIRSMARSGAGDEKAHRRRGSLWCGLLRESQECSRDRQRCGGNNELKFLHSRLLRK